jgi:hypothetical protein
VWVANVKSAPLVRRSEEMPGRKGSPSPAFTFE